MQPMTMLSVPVSYGTIYAIVPDFPREALARLREDDDVWARPNVYQHWFFEAAPEISRLRPRNRIAFRFVESPERVALREMLGASS